MTLATPQVRVEPRPWHDPVGAALRQAQRAELDARYGCADHEPGAAPTDADIALFLVASAADGTALGCGALRMMDAPGPGAEIKRMYVVPEARGTGVAVAILRALEDAARARGVTQLLLETGTEQPDAVRFYEREGYVAIPLFGPYVGSDLSYCYARTL